ncbi:MAG: hypothetical protein RL189_1956 [Pseudomonadota bacterium]|jgi:hypothetical protein
MMAGGDIYFALAAVPIVLQGLALAFDEFVFHYRRGLPRWERIGHPLDTLTVLGVCSVAHFLPLNHGNFLIFLVASFLSCLFVTKDEWVHAKLCDAREQWLHGVLFICHPLVFVSIAFFWVWRDAPHIFALNALRVPLVATGLWAQVVVLCLFLTYQLIYWNFVRPPVSDPNAKSMPPATKSESADPRSYASEIG